jgi:hypothetical protein
LWPNPGPKGFSLPSGLGHEFPKEVLRIKEQKEGHKTKKSIKRKTENDRKI